jgi:hypothetical protein
MPDLVRVRNAGFEYNVGRAHAEANDLEILDEPARDSLGALVPRVRVDGRSAARKRKTSVDAEAKKKTSAAKKATEKKAATPADSNPPSEQEQ